MVSRHSTTKPPTRLHLYILRAFAIAWSQESIHSRERRSTTIPPMRLHLYTLRAFAISWSQESIHSLKTFYHYITNKVASVYIKGVGNRMVSREYTWSQDVLPLYILKAFAIAWKTFYHYTTNEVTSVCNILRAFAIA